MAVSLHLGNMQIPLESISPFYVNFQVYLYSKIWLHYNVNEESLGSSQSKQEGLFAPFHVRDEKISWQEPTNATYKCHRPFAMLMWKKGWRKMGLLSMLGLLDNLPSHGSWPLSDLPVPPEQIPIRCSTPHSRHQCTVWPAQQLLGSVQPCTQQPPSPLPNT